MPPSNDSVDDITISLGEGGERSPHHDKRMYKAQRNNSQHLPLEDQSHLPREKSKSYSSKLSLRSILYNPFTFRDSMKRAGSSNRMEMIREGSVKSNDEELVESFRKMLQEDGQLPLKHSDSHTLLRFLRMRAYDFTKAKEMYLKMLKWRDEHAVDTILKEFQFEEYLEVKKCYPHGFHGVDIYGRPLYIERIGMVDLNRLLEVTTIDRFAKYHISEQEKTLNLRYPACSIAANKHVASTTSILDVKGVGMNNFSKPAREIFMEIQKIDSNNYPETLHQLFIVNAGSGFRVLWKALKAFLEPRTLAKIQVLGSNFQNNLLEIIDPSTLPSFLGGHCTCPEFGGCLLNDKGPWNDPEITDALRANFERETNISKEGNSSMRSSIATNPNMVPSFDVHVSNKFQGLQEGLEEIKNIMATVVGKQEDITRQIEELKKLCFFVPKPKP